ncbi:MAG: C25 family cysteine peptidase [Chloroflexi bacterium]|nr:C25 family cysteine peptidase [Chloroflexota bacterium]
MISRISSQPKNNQMIDRNQIIQLLYSGLNVKAYRFSRQVAMAWLSNFPGDLSVNLFYVKTLTKENRIPQAIPILEKILRTDPLYEEALSLGVELFKKENSLLSKKAAGVIQALGGKPIQGVDLPDWGIKLFLVRQAINKKQYETAQALLTNVFGDSAIPELTDILHLELTSLISDTETVLNLSRLYHARWPDCLQISLILAKSWMKMNQEDEAIKLIHFCASNDASAQVPVRLWGSNFPYKPLYPTKMEIIANFSIPAEVSGSLGLNQLTSGDQKNQLDSVIQLRTDVSSFDGYSVNKSDDGSFIEHPKNDQKDPQAKDVTVVEVENELKKVAEKIQHPILSTTDNRFPTYVLLSMKKGLEEQFGIQSSSVIIAEMRTLSKVIQERDGWSSIVFLPDDLEICGKYGITPIDSLDPWKIKLALIDLDKSLQKTGERIGCVLIVGGEKVVPFHKLPNPTEDSDLEVLSDSPYGSMDTNYFISDWSVGRLPGESGVDAGLLLAQVRNTKQYHNDSIQSRSWLNQIIRFITFWNRRWIINSGNLGYTASVWRRSSLAAFRPMGEGKNLFLSPNGTQKPFDPIKLATTPLGYFNLHGVEDGSEWYGQKDPLDKDSGPDFPVALRPSDISKNSAGPRIVFSEACYGGYISEKLENQSIALTMMGKCVLAIIASTTIAYGSVTTPLIGADLMGYLIMKNLHDGLPVGVSFIKSKVEFVREMNRRQGYLDAEDQKTLISFVLYGDPLVSYDPYQAMTKTLGRESTPPIIKNICDRVEFEDQNEGVAPKMISQAKTLVKDYLPGIEYAEVKINHQNVRYDHASSDGKKGGSPRQPKRVVISFSKQMSHADVVHRQFAKVTLDQQGKMIKLAVSR